MILRSTQQFWRQFLRRWKVLNLRSLSGNKRSADSLITIIVKREIESHKTLGKSMVAHIQKEMSKTDDEAVRTLLQHLTEDEKRHSEILDTIAQRCYSMIR